MNEKARLFYKISRNVIYLSGVDWEDLRKTTIRGEKRTKGEDYERK